MSFDKIDDPCLIVALKRLDDEAWRKLYQQVSPRLLSFVKGKLISFGKYLSVQDEAEEIVEKTFTKAIEYIVSYDPQKSMITTWIFTIASRLACDTQRSVKKKNSFLQKWTGISTTSTSALNTQTAEQLLTNIGVEPSKFTETEMMYLKAMYIEEFSDDIIASECGVSKAAVRKARERLLYKLRRLLEQQANTL